MDKLLKVSQYSAGGGLPAASDAQAEAATSNIVSLVPANVPTVSSYQAVVIVSDDTARLALTAAQVRSGSRVEVTSTGLAWEVNDVSALPGAGAFTPAFNVATSAETQELSSSTLAVTPAGLAGLYEPGTAFVEVGATGPGKVGYRLTPFATINAALIALKIASPTGGVIRLGVGIHAPITDDYDPSTPTVIAADTLLFDNLTFIGAKTPVANAGKTALECGTIIQGSLICDRPGMKFYNLGVDSGSAVCTALYGGVAQDALDACVNIGQAASPSVKAPRAGIEVHNCITLCQSPTAPVHGILIENVINPLASNNVTIYAIHGLIIKSLGGYFNGHTSIGCQGDTVIIKSDTYAECSNVTLTNITGQSVTGVDTSGIIIQENRGSVLTGITISGVTMVNTGFDVHFISGAAGLIHSCTIDGLVTTRGVAGNSLAIQHSGAGQTEAGSVLVNGFSSSALNHYLAPDPVVVFDGTGPVTIPTSAGLIPGTGPYYVGAWIKLDGDLSVNRMLVAGPNNALAFYITGTGEISADKTGVSSICYTRVLAWKFGQRYFFEHWRDASNNVYIARDGQVLSFGVGSSTTSTADLTAQVTRIGGWEPTSGFRLIGELARLSLYVGSAPTREEAGQIMHTGRTDSRIYLEYEADPSRSYGTTLVDTSGNGLNATLGSGAVLTPTVDAPNTFSAITVNGVAALRGASGALSVYRQDTDIAAWEILSPDGGLEFKGGGTRLGYVNGAGRWTVPSVQATDGLITFNEASPPATPATGLVHLYAKADGKLYAKDDAAVESLVSGVVTQTITNGVTATAPSEDAVFDALATKAAAAGADDIEITDTTKGYILKSPDATRYRITVANGGALVTTAI